MQDEFRTEQFNAKVQYLSELAPLKGLALSVLKHISPCFQLVVRRASGPAGGGQRQQGGRLLGAGALRNSGLKGCCRSTQSRKA